MAISEYSTPVQNTLEQYIPVPLDQMMRAGQATQQRYDQSQDLDSSTQSGLASIEARSSGYQQYVNNAVSSYKNDMSSLVDKYNGRIDDPQFQREQKQVINKYKNDPNWQVIKQGNQNIQMDQEIAAKLRAEGKLVLNPTSKFTGTDKSGNLTAYTPGVKEVNTLDDWDKALQIAHGSMNFDGKGYNTNKYNLGRAKSAILTDITNNGPQTRDLMQAYQEQGYTPEQAKQAVLSNVGTMANKYGEVKTRDEGYFSNILQGESIRQNAKFHNDEIQSRKDIASAHDAAMIERARIMASKHKNPDGSDVITPYAVPTNNSPIAAGSDNLRAYTADQSNVPINADIKYPTNVSGKYFKIDPKESSEQNKINQTGGFKVNQGSIVGAKNIWVTEGGNLVVGGKDYSVTQKTDPKTGKIENYLGNQKVHKQTVIEYNDANSEGKSGAEGDHGSWKPVSYYKLANKDEAIRFMGPQAASYEEKNKNNQFYNASIKQNTDGTVSANQKFKYPNINKIAEIAHYTGSDVNQLQQSIKQDIDQLNSKGISKDKFEQLRQMLDDNFTDSLYHQNVIVPQFSNPTKTKSINPIDDTVYGE